MDWRQVEQMLCGRVEEVCRHLLPNGKKNGTEWCVGSVNGEPGDSLRVNLSGKAGVWCDFAANDKGNNLMGLWCHVRKQPFAQCIREAKEWLGVPDDSWRRVQQAVPKKQEPVDGKPPVTVAELWPKCMPLTEGGPVWNYLVEARKLEPAVLEAYDVREMVLPQNRWVMVFPYYLPHAKETPSVIEEMIASRHAPAQDGSASRIPSWLKFEALKRVDGKKVEWTTTAPEKCLWGMQVLAHPMFKQTDHVLIVEGEKDALSWASYGCGAWRVAGGRGVLPVSTPFGAKHRAPAVKNAQGLMEQRPSPNREWLDRCANWINDFEIVFVGMDMDEPGRKAAVDIITEIGLRRCRLVELPWEEIL